MRKLLVLLPVLMLLLGMACAEEAFSIDPGKPVVALTFDDGPSKVTPRVLELLKQYNCHATFFMVGSRIQLFPEETKMVAESGNEIGTHTWQHNDVRKLESWTLRDNLQKCIAETQRVAGVEPLYFRPPYGYMSNDAYVACRQVGLYAVIWSVDSHDWETRNPQLIVSEVMGRVRNGDIILLHDLYEETAVALETLLPALREAGYQVLTVDELFSLRSEPLAFKEVYRGLDPKMMRTQQTGMQN